MKCAFPEMLRHQTENIKNIACFFGTLRVLLFLIFAVLGDSESGVNELEASAGGEGVGTEARVWLDDSRTWLNSHLTLVLPSTSTVLMTPRLGFLLREAALCLPRLNFRQRSLRHLVAAASDLVAAGRSDLSSFMRAATSERSRKCASSGMTSSRSTCEESAARGGVR